MHISVFYEHFYCCGTFAPTINVVKTAPNNNNNIYLHILARQIKRFHKMNKRAKHIMCVCLCVWVHFMRNKNKSAMKNKA